VAQGTGSPLRFFEVTNRSEAVGFFANRNHFAALNYMLLLFAAAWIANSLLDPKEHLAAKRLTGTKLVMLLACMTIFIVFVAAQAMARSRAGLGLTVLAMIGAFALVMAARQRGRNTTLFRIVIGAGAIAVLLALQFAMLRIMSRFSVDPLEDSRLTLTATTLEAAAAFFPFGSGIGSFVPVYAMYEKFEGAMPNAYINQAHNDWAQLVLEAGLPGVVVLLAATVWLVARAVAVWRTPSAGAEAIDRALARAAGLALLLLMLHSAVDYPLRTTAILCVFAYAAALLIAPPVEANLGQPFEGWSFTPAKPARPQAATVHPVVALGAPAPGAQMPDASGSRPSTSLAPATDPDANGGIEWPAEWKAAPRGPAKPADDAPTPARSAKPTRPSGKPPGDRS
jgi:O-antigen ligase